MMITSVFIIVEIIDRIDLFERVFGNLADQAIPMMTVLMCIPALVFVIGLIGFISTLNTDS